MIDTYCIADYDFAAMTPEARSLYSLAFVGSEKTKDKLIKDFTKFRKETEKLEKERVTYQEVYKLKQQETKDTVKRAGGKVANRKLVTKLKAKSAKEAAKTKKKPTKKATKKDDNDDIDIPPSAKDRLLKNRAEVKVLEQTKRKRRRKAVTSDVEDEVPPSQEVPLNTPKKLSAEKIVEKIASSGTRSRPITPKKLDKENVAPSPTPSKTMIGSPPGYRTKQTGDHPHKKIIIKLV